MRKLRQLFAYSKKLRISVDYWSALFFSSCFTGHVLFATSMVLSLGFEEVEKETGRVGLRKCA